MRQPGGLACCEVVAFVPTKDANAARAFYEGQLGLTFVSDDSFALMFEANGTTIRVVRVEDFHPAPFTILGWKVADIGETVARLGASGIAFRKYPWFEQEENGIWTAPGGTRVAWFADPDGNVLSISQG